MHLNQKIRSLLVLYFVYALTFSFPWPCRQPILYEILIAGCTAQMCSSFWAQQQIGINYWCSKTHGLKSTAWATSGSKLQGQHFQWIVDFDTFQSNWRSEKTVTEDHPWLKLCNTFGRIPANLRCILDRWRSCMKWRSLCSDRGSSSFHGIFFPQQTPKVLRDGISWVNWES